MIPEIKRILYTTDLSDNSAYAFRYAINSALKHGAGIIILHVFELITTTNRNGKGIIRNTFLGSTSKRVLRRTRKPVFIIPLPKEEADIGLGDI